ncbi:probable glutamate receptor [Diachasma alloeum]|uniref:Ionotropic receptor 111 n=1 Tax=Diachasma alloeum TaxID=454923 RepID=A0A4E0RNK7_9HYME|nr:probable glutamate receptor [Diachasma alloeum]THK33006.1 ionotropic receptor 111 [Diachasma alloeum]
MNFPTLVLLLSTLNAISTIVSDKFSDFNYYGDLIKNVHDKYKGTGVIIASEMDRQPFERITIRHETTRKLSNEGVSTLFLDFSQFENRLNVYMKETDPPLIVIVLDTIGALRSFETIAKGLDMGYFVWLIFFSRDAGQDVCDVCCHPRGNLFNLKFNSKVIVLCCDSKIIREWWCVRDNRTWSQEIGHTNNQEITWVSDELLRDRRKSMHGLVLRVAAVKGTALFLERDGKYYGYIGEILAALSEAMNFTVSQIIWDNDYGYWNRKTLNWTGVIGRIHREEADIGVPDFLITDARYNAVNFAYPIMNGAYQVHVKKLEVAQVAWNAYFKVLTVDVWMVIIGFILITPILVTLIEYRKRECPLFPLLLEHYMFVWSIFCQEGFTFQIEMSGETSSKIIYVSLSLSTLVIYTAYGALMTSILAVSSSFVPFATMEEFADDGTYKFIVLNNTLFYNTFKFSNNTLMKKMMALMEPTHFLPQTHEEGFKQVCSGRVGFWASEKIKKIYDNLIPCEITSVGTEMKESSTLITPRHSEFMSLINYNIQQFKYNGMFQRLEKKYWKQSQQNEKSLSPVHLQEISPFVFALFIGGLIAFVILVIERNSYLSVKKVHNRKSKQVRKNRTSKFPAYSRL